MPEREDTRPIKVEFLKLRTVISDNTDLAI